MQEHGMTIGVHIGGLNAPFMYHYLLQKVEVGILGTFLWTCTYRSGDEARNETI